MSAHLRSHREVCTGQPCGCCPSCGEWRWVGNTCGACGQSRAGVTANVPATETKAKPVAADGPSLFDGEDVREGIAPSEADLRSGAVLACLDCGTVKANPSNATGSGCDCGGTATKHASLVVARKLYGTPLPRGVVDPEAVDEPDDDLDFEPLPAPEPVNPAPVSHATDPDIVARDTPGIVGHASPPQSHAAANALPTGKRRVQVLLVLARQGMNGATAEEMEAHANLGGSTIRPRLLELERDGFVERTRDNRPTRSGMLAAVYRVTPRGRSAADRLEGRPDGMP